MVNKVKVWERDILSLLVFIASSVFWLKNAIILLQIELTGSILFPGFIWTSIISFKRFITQAFREGNVCKNSLHKEFLAISDWKLTLFSSFAVWFNYG